MKRDIFLPLFFLFFLFLLLLLFPLEEARRERTIFLSDNSLRFHSVHMENLLSASTR